METLVRKQKKKKRAVFATLFTYMLISAMFLMTLPAYASGGISSEWYQTESQAGTIIQTLALAGGIVGLAWCGIEYTYGNEEVANKAKSKAITIIIAVAAIFILPYVIRLGKDLGQRYKWDPSTLG